MKRTTLFRTPLAFALIGAAVLAAAPTHARVTKIVIDQTTSTGGSDIPYEILIGRAFGEIDPNDSHNTIITDIGLAPVNGNGKATYVASFTITKPVDMSQSSGLLWHDVPNRGGRITISNDLRRSHDVGVSSAWQGDNSGTAGSRATLVPDYASQPTPISGTPVSNEWVKVPTLGGVTGKIIGRIVNRNTDAAPLLVMGNPIPYFPADVTDNSGDTLTTILKETVDGKVTVGVVVPNSDWKYCGGGTFDAPTPVTVLPVQVCIKGKFDPTKLYQLQYNATDPYVLGVGTAAFRDVGSFFRYASEDDEGNPNPLAAGTGIQKAIVRGSSQSGNFTRHLIHIGMNQDEAGRIVHDGAWPLIAARRVANNSRWGQPDGVLELYQMGSEGPQWWQNYPDRVRDIKPGGILKRCSETETCPKIIETFGGSEVFALKMTTSWVGTDPKADIPLPDNVRRYYLPSSTHGGGNGDMSDPTATFNAVSCPGNNWGRGTMRANPVPSTQLVNRMRVALREWVLNGTEPPPSKWPHMGGNKSERTLVEATQAAMGFPSGVPGIPNSIFLPENFVFPIFDYDWGPEYDHYDATGNPTNEPPIIKSVIKMMVPKVDADGNELGGVPTVLRDAPLGTYTGWNITAGPSDPTYDGRPFHAGQVCNYVGGMTPFAKTKAQRLANNDPRPSLEERYGTHQGYVDAVKKAADNAACQGYLLAGPDAAAMGAKCTMPSIPAGFPDDWVAVVTQAMNSNVCASNGGNCGP